MDGKNERRKDIKEEKYTLFSISEYTYSCSAVFWLVIFIINVCIVNCLILELSTVFNDATCVKWKDILVPWDFVTSRFYCYSAR